MPYLQIDLPASYPTATKRDLARRLGDLFAEIMQTTPSMVNVAFRELGAGNLYRCGPGEPEPAAVIQCDIRNGRPASQRLALAQALVTACTEALNLRIDRVVVEFTQHGGDEMYRDGSWTKSWDPGEAETGGGTPRHD
ncbi:MAG: hypothetical protein QOF51_1723 [Chloroflexota bacterium]|jgi:phenylpyruvate tautomerase PptA (4-oxalocrotonate tautomerase family)|nr:hypothetical protein [Chloroflexota bacterium]